MKRNLVRLVLVAVIIVSMVETVGTLTIQPLGSSAAAHPCVSDSDCQGGHICCPITGTCTTVRGCRKDPNLF